MTAILAASIASYAGVFPVEISLTDSSSGGSSSGVFTFSSADIGAADPSRWIYVVATLESNANMTGGTVASNAGEIVAGPGRNTGPTPDTGSMIFRYKLTTGTTANITVTHGGGTANCGVAVYRVVGGEGEYEQGANSNAAGTLSVTPPANSGVIAGAAQNGGTPVFNSGVTHDLRINVGSDRLCAGSRVDASSPGAISIGSDVDVNRNMSVVVIT